MLQLFPLRIVAVSGSSKYVKYVKKICALCYYVWQYIEKIENNKCVKTCIQYIQKWDSVNKQKYVRMQEYYT